MTSGEPTPPLTEPPGDLETLLAGVPEDVRDTYLAARLLWHVERCYEVARIVDALGEERDEALVTSARFLAHRLGKIAERLDRPTEP